MALIDCSECGKQISEKAAACPNCGAPPTLASQPAAAKVSPPPPKKRNSWTPTILGVVVLAILLGILYGFWQARTSDRAAPISAGLIGVLRQPRKVVNEKIQLEEGQAMTYGFDLDTDSRVQVEVKANPKNVDVMLMDPGQAAKFKEAMGKLFGGKYTYKQALSAEKTLNMDKTASLPAGQWVIVVMRPREAILFTEETAVQTVVTVY